MIRLVMCENYKRNILSLKIAVGRVKQLPADALRGERSCELRVAASDELSCAASRGERVCELTCCGVIY